MAENNVSKDLLWEITRHNTAYLVKRKTNGGVQLSRDPLNLRNKHSKKHSGAINDKSIGLVPTENGGITMHTKKKNGQLHTTKFSARKSSRKSYHAIVNSTTKKNYRADLRGDAVARASAILKSQRKPPKERPATKPRGNKAKKAAAAGSAGADVE